MFLREIVEFYINQYFLNSCNEFNKYICECHKPVKLRKSDPGLSHSSPEFIMEKKCTLSNGLMLDLDFLKEEMCYVCGYYKKYIVIKTLDRSRKSLMRLLSTNKYTLKQAKDIVLGTI